MERKYSFFQAPFLAFGNPDLYRDVASNWSGSGALYIFLLSTVAWSITCLSMFVPVTKVIGDKNLVSFCNQIPGIVVQDGKLTMDRPSPYDVKDNGTNVPVMRIAADRKKEKMIVGDPPMVFTQTAWLMSKRTMEDSKSSASYKLASYEDSDTTDKDAVPAKILLRYSKINESIPKLEMSGPIVHSLIEKTLLLGPLAILIVGWPFVFLGHLMQLLVYGGITALVASMMQREMPFEKSMRMAAIAMTPGILVSVALSALQWSVTPLRQINSAWFMLSILMAITYIVCVVRSLPDTHAQPSIPPLG